MSTIRSARTRRKLPPLRLFVFAASAVLFLSMIAIIFRRHAAGTLEGRFVVLAGNALLWLVPFAGRAIFRDKIGDAMWAIFVVTLVFTTTLIALPSSCTSSTHSARTSLLTPWRRPR